MAMTTASDGFMQRTFSRLRQAWGALAFEASGDLSDTIGTELSDRDVARLRQAIDACLEARGGMVSARAHAADLGRAYLNLSYKGRKRFLELMVSDYGVRRAAVEAAIAQFQQAHDDDARQLAEAALRQALIPPRIQLLAQFNSLDNGIKFLVDLRAELMRIAKHNKNLQPLNKELRNLLASWFDVGFLELRRITWETPAALLEKLIAYEAVHQIRSWADLKNRLAPDRRLYAFFHPHMHDEPLIFVQVALTRGISSSIQELLDESAPLLDAEQADTAVFYSISNCQIGLKGVNFGGFLIKQVVDDLARSLPRLKHFSTLSPIPKFRLWLNQQLEDQSTALLTAAEQQNLQAMLGEPDPQAVSANPLQTALAEDNWAADMALQAVLAPILCRLCANYLISAQRNQRAYDPVADFHLNNGASLHRINWLADCSMHGIEQSAGMMVNYLYRLSQIEANHEVYNQGRVIADTAVRKLL